jgi:ubiquinone/menaquinone biosynthesis C-methylase UbiE
VREFKLTSLLDVGTGTGRAVTFLRRTHPGAFVIGIEPAVPLLARAQAKLEINGVGLASASGYQLPFGDASLDAVCQFGVLHHVKDPNAVVREMMRVAKRAVFLSDSNRFGQGPLPARLVKLLLAQCGLWPAANFVKTRGTGYTITAGDGLAYSYSVYDSFATLRAWADRLVLVPTSRVASQMASPAKHGAWLHPLLTSSHVLLCAFRDR